MATADLFQDITNAVLDLQAADYQSYALPLQRLGRLLRHESLKEKNQKILSGIDLEDFLEMSLATESSMAGSAHLAWPDSDTSVLGIQLALVQRFCAEPDYLIEFGHTFYYTGSNVNEDLRAVVRALIVPFVRDYRAFVQPRSSEKTDVVYMETNAVFIVHGHDEAPRLAVARFLEKLALRPIILSDQPNRGRTIIEKFEAHSDVGFAVVLLTPDDIGAPKGGDCKPRARQNVILELGYFIGKLGRSHVCALRSADIEIPSDILGVIWTDYDTAGGWKLNLARELRAAGYAIDMNLL